MQEMTPLQLYAVAMCALFVFELAKMGALQMNRIKETRPRIMAILGLSFMVGLPILMALDVMAP